MVDNTGEWVAPTNLRDSETTKQNTSEQFRPMGKEFGAAVKATLARLRRMGILPARSVPKPNVTLGTIH